jgi:hypothetical protein
MGIETYTLSQFFVGLYINYIYPKSNIAQFYSALGYTVKASLHPLEARNIIIIQVWKECTPPRSN